MSEYEYYDRDINAAQKIRDIAENELVRTLSNDKS
jgi:hypothetical protein